MELLIFSELINSNDVFLLLIHSLTLFAAHAGLGTYLQGIPTSNTVDFFWGTNAGLRVIPLLTFLTILQKVFFNNTSTIYLFLSVILPFGTFLLACRMRHKITSMDVIAAVFFGANIWIINRIFTGFWQLNIAYAFLPFLIVIPLIFASKKVMRKTEILFFAGLYCLFTSIIFSSQPHFLILIALFAVLHISSLLITKNFLQAKKIFLLYIISLLFFFCLNAYFIVPGLFFSERQFTAPNQYFSLGSVIFNSQGNLFWDILRFDPRGPSTAPVIWTWIQYFQFFPILLFIFTFLFNRKRNYIYIILIICFLFFAKGLNEPFPNVSNWIYQNVFFMHYFRDPARFIAGVTLFSALSISEFRPKPLAKFLQQMVVLCVIGIFICINIPSLTAPKTDVFTLTTIPKAYVNLQHYVNNTLRNENQRLLILPNESGLVGYPWYKNASPNTSNTIFDDIIPLTIPLADSTNYPDNYSNQLSAYITNEFTKTYDPKVLTPLGVKYLLVDESIQQPQSEKDIATQSARILDSRPNEFQKVFSQKPLTLYKVVQNGQLLTDQQPLFAIGDFSTIINHYKTGSTRPIILLNQPINNELLRTSVLKNKQLLIDTKDPTLTMAAEILAPHYAVDILKAGWDYDKIFVNDEPYKMKYILNGGQLFTSGRSVAAINKSDSMLVPHTLEKGKYRILLKALTENNTASIQITAGSIKKTIHLVGNQELTWTNAGTITVNQDLSSVIITKADVGPLVIDYFLLIPETVWNQETGKVKSAIKSMSQHQENQSLLTQNNSLTIEKDDLFYTKKPLQYFTARFSYGDYWRSDVQSQKFISDGYGMTFMDFSKGISTITYFPNIIFQFLLGFSIIAHIILLVFCGYFLYRGLRRTS